MKKFFAYILSNILSITIFLYNPNFCFALDASRYVIKDINGAYASCIKDKNIIITNNQSLYKKPTINLTWKLDESCKGLVSRYKIYATYNLFDDTYKNDVELKDRISQTDILLGAYNIKSNKEDTQKASIKNAEFNTTYNLKISLLDIYNNETDKYDFDALKIDIPKEEENYIVPSFQAASDKVVKDGQTFSKVYALDPYKPIFNKENTLLNLQRFNGPAIRSPDRNRIGLESELLDWGQSLFFFEVGIVAPFLNNFYDKDDFAINVSKDPYITPEEMHIYKNCELEYKINPLSNLENLTAIPNIKCTYDDKITKERIKMFSKNFCTESGDTLLCKSPSYQVSVALLAKKKNANISFSINRADTLENNFCNGAKNHKNTVSLVVGNFLRSFRLYNNNPYPFGLELRTLLGSIIIADITKLTHKEYKEKLEHLNLGNTNRYKDTIYEDFYKNAIKPLYDTAISSKFDSIGYNFIPVIERLQSLCATEYFKSLYKTTFDAIDFKKLKVGLINKEYQLRRTFLESNGYKLVKYKERLQCENSKDYYDENTCKELERKQNSINTNENETYRCKKLWRWSPETPQEIIQDIIDFEIFQINEVKKIIGDAKIAGIVDGGEAFMNTPSVYNDYIINLNEQCKDRYSANCSDTTLGKVCCDNKETSNKNLEEQASKNFLMYLSKKYRMQHKMFTDAFNEAFSVPYAYYTQSQSYGSKDGLAVGNTLFAEITHQAYDYEPSNMYLSKAYRNHHYLKPVINKLYVDDDKPYIQYFNTSYKKHGIVLHQFGAMYGLLKLRYMLGTKSIVLYYHNDASTKYTLLHLPDTVKDTKAVSRVHAEFGYLSKFIDDSDIVQFSFENNCKGINFSKCALMTEEYGFDKMCLKDCSNLFSKYFIMKDELTPLGIVRKERGKKRWLILGFSMDYATRESLVNIPNIETPIDIISSPAGNIYEVSYRDKNGNVLADDILANDVLATKSNLYVKLLDNSETYTLMSKESDSLLNFQNF